MTSFPSEEAAVESRAPALCLRAEPPPTGHSGPANVDFQGLEFTSSSSSARANRCFSDRVLTFFRQPAPLWSKMSFDHKPKRVYDSTGFYPVCAAVSHTWFSCNSSNGYFRIPLPTSLEYLGNSPETRQSAADRLFT
ncbi:hypothetical protein EYF80_024143 [Liparis tanakae]|uniref:Uncharacterized protein n=1 Tax=Liparis tanakae TaxID=230148 RepID=A0A4Z2HL02_9TELE|nr:hypothetical protein EYF80_024143 [Liparis tanakae]